MSLLLQKTISFQRSSPSVHVGMCKTVFTSDMQSDILYIWTGLSQQSPFYSAYCFQPADVPVSLKQFQVSEIEILDIEGRFK